MNRELFEKLLFEEESVTLDFKREQYLFAQATDEIKSELLKDILGFANAWRRADAYILIGVEEKKGERSVVHGIQSILEDSSLQQFINSKTNRPVQFHYQTFQFEDKQVGIIRIEEQERPIYLKKDFGKLKAREVYVRRGTSTNPQMPAALEEIAKMGIKSGPSSALLTVEFADAVSEQLIGTSLQWHAEFCDLPERDQIPDWTGNVPNNRLFNHPTLSIPDYRRRVNTDYLRERCHYEFITRLFKPVRLAITNIGQAPAQRVQLEIIIPSNERIVALEENDFPRLPEKIEEMFTLTGNLSSNLQHMMNESLCINVNSNRTRIEIDSGDLQPGKQYISELFYVGIGESRSVEIKGQVFSNDLPTPHKFTLNIAATVSQTRMTLQQISSLE